MPRKTTKLKNSAAINSSTNVQNKRRMVTEQGGKGTPSFAVAPRAATRKKVTPEANTGIDSVSLQISKFDVDLHCQPVLTVDILE